MMGMVQFPAKRLSSLSSLQVMTETSPDGYKPKKEGARHRWPRSPREDLSTSSVHQNFTPTVAPYVRGSSAVANDHSPATVKATVETSLPLTT